MSEALRLAECVISARDLTWHRDAAAELRRLHAENEAFREGLLDVQQRIAKVQSTCDEWDAACKKLVTENEALRADAGAVNDALGVIDLCMAPQAIEALREANSSLATAAILPDDKMIVNRADYAELVEALRDGLSVCASVSVSIDRRIVRDGVKLYAQTEDWCRWASEDVEPKLRAVLAKVEARDGS